MVTEIRREINGRQLVWPEAQHVSDLWLDWEPWDWRISKVNEGPHGFPRHARVWTFPDYLGSIGRRRVRGGEQRLDCFVSTSGSGVPSFWGNPTDELVQVIEREMLRIDGDTINVQAIRWSTGETLITAHNSVILGTRWIALLPAGERLPGEGE